MIEFHDKYGTPTTVSAFGVSRATIYLWKKSLEKVEESLRVLFQSQEYQKGLNKRLGDLR